MDESGDPVQADFATFLSWYQNVSAEDREVASDVVEQYRITSRFLGLNHASDDGIPLLFETLVVDESNERRSFHDLQKWSATRTGAMNNHQLAIEFVRSTLIGN
jgi:hypothetical protein